jgi:hypothetical protein
VAILRGALSMVNPLWNIEGFIFTSLQKKNGVLGEGCCLTYFYIFLASR